MGDAGCGESCRQGRRLCRGVDRRLLGRTVGGMSLDNHIRKISALLGFLFPLLQYCFSLDALWRVLEDNRVDRKEVHDSNIGNDRGFGYESRR